VENQVIITWEQVKEKIKTLDPKLKYYGVPRGGQPVAAMLNPVDTPEEADVIIDDLIDSGRTRDRFLVYNKPFVALFNKKTDERIKGKWLVFPWEKNEQPAEDAVVRLLEFFGEDPTREGLVDTPKRYLKFFKEFFAVPEFNFTTFDSEGMDEMILQKDIPFFSLCEHHIAPFFGVAHVAYIPEGKIVGLSKLARTVDLFSRKLQNQERISSQIAHKLQDELSPLGVAVCLKAQHLCMTMRGVKKHDTQTVTTKLLGSFLHDSRARSEFFSAISL
jgi:GTP cyclohydrolase I